MPNVTQRREPWSENALYGLHTPWRGIAMASFESFNALLAETGALLECVAVVSCGDQPDWILMLDDQHEFELALDQALGILHVGACLGPCPSVRREELLSTFLEFNEQFRATGGLRFGMDPDSSQLTFGVAFACEGLDGPVLAGRLRRLSQIIDGWREILAADPALSEAVARRGADDLVFKI